MKSKLIPLAVMFASASVASGSILIQELFDNISAGNASLSGAGDTLTSIGLAETWATNGSTGIFTSNNFNVIGTTLPGLPASNGGNGGIWNNVGVWNTDVYAARLLETPIDFGVDRVIYFSVRLRNGGDTAVGTGLASGTDGTAQFVGAGFHWNGITALTSQSAANAAYITHGTLGQDLDGNNNGVYAAHAHEAAGGVDGYGLLVGRITINATGDDVIEIKRYAENAVIDDDLDAITWSATSAVDLSMTATHLLVWINGQNNGSGNGELDAVRFGDTWTDVTGVSLAGSGQPVISGASAGNITASGADATADLLFYPADVILHWDTVDQGTGVWTNSNPLGSQPVGSVGGAITGLQPDTVYFYRFHAVNTLSDPDLEAWSEAGRTFATTPTGVVISDLDAEPFTTYEVDLFWSDLYNTETGFLIQRSPAGAGTWTTVGTAPANSTFYTDRHSGLSPDTAYDYRILATNGAGNSDPSNVSTTTTLPGTPLETKLLVNFNGSLDGTVYTPAVGEIDLTGTFKANGNPNVSGGLATINPGNESGPDGFDIDPATLGSLTTQNWVAEALVTYQSTGGVETTPVLIDVQGDTNLRLRSELDPNVLQMFYWNGSSGAQQFTALPPNGVKVHLALAWDAGSATLTGYVNGVLFGTASNGPFATPDPTSLSFGYFGRAGFEGRGIDGILDAVALQTGTATVNPATDFLILPETQSYGDWITGFPVGEMDGFDEDADGDGLENGVEAFLGTDPSEANGGAITEISTNGTVTTFTHPQASPALGDVTGSYEWSLDLGTWYAGDGVEGPGGGPTVGIPTVSPVGGLSTVTATSSVPLERLFIRVVAEN